MKHQTEAMNNFRIIDAFAGMTREQFIDAWKDYFHFIGAEYKEQPGIMAANIQTPEAFAPMFYLKNVSHRSSSPGVWVSCFRQEPPQRIAELMESYVLKTGKPGIFLIGPIPSAGGNAKQGGSGHIDFFISHDKITGAQEIIKDYPITFTVCPCCGQLGLEFFDHSNFICSYCGSECDTGEDNDSFLGIADNEIKSAIMQRAQKKHHKRPNY